MKFCTERLYYPVFCICKLHFTIGMIIIAEQEYNFWTFFTTIRMTYFVFFSHLLQPIYCRESFRYVCVTESFLSFLSHSDSKWPFFLCWQIFVNVIIAVTISLPRTFHLINLADKWYADHYHHKILIVLFHFTLFLFSYLLFYSLFINFYLTFI